MEFPRDQPWLTCGALQGISSLWQGIEPGAHAQLAAWLKLVSLGRTLRAEAHAAWLMQAAHAGLHRQCLFGGLRIGLYDPVKAFYVKTLGIDDTKDAPFALKVGAGLTTGALAISIASPTDLVKVHHL